MSGAEVRAEIRQGIADAGNDVGTGELVGTLLQRGANTGTASNPVFGPDVKAAFTCMLGSFSARERAGTAIEATDTKITAVGDGSVTPAVNDRIEINGIEYKIYGVDPLKPLGVDLMFKIWARR